MKKNNNGFLTAILGGIITCFVCIGMVFAFSSNSSTKFKGNNVLPNDEEIRLGDVANCKTYNYYCTNGSYSGGRCVIEETHSSAPDDCDGGSWTNGICHTYTYENPVQGSCKTCEDGYTLVNNACMTEAQVCLSNCHSSCDSGTGNTTEYCNNYCDIQCGLATPTPTPTPVPCSQIPFNECPTDRCYAYQNSCHSNPQATSTATPTATSEISGCVASCVASGGTTSGCIQQCNATPTPVPCSQIPFNQCPTDRCYAYQNSCHSTPQATPTTAPTATSEISGCIARCVASGGPTDGCIQQCNATPTPDLEKCYCNPINSRCEWRNTNANNWIGMACIGSSELCTTYSTNGSEGCFRKGDNTYVWGSYGNTLGYEMVNAPTQAICETYNEGDPVGESYSLSCPVSVILLGQTISCTYSTSGTATLSSAGSTNTSIASAVKDENYTKYVKVTASSTKTGSVSVYGITSNGKKTNYVPLLVAEKAIPDKCTVSATTSSLKTSIDEDNIQNSYYIVDVTIAGADCSGQTATYTATNAKSVTPSKYDISEVHGTSTINTSFKVYPSSACKDSRATVTLTNGEKSTTSSVTLLYDWHSQENVCETNPAYTSFEEADKAGANVYYTNYGKCANENKNGYRTKWTRGGCGGGGNTPTPTPTSTPEITPTPTPTPTPGVTPTPTPTPIIKIPYCYRDENNEYHFTPDPKPNWVLVPNISRKEDCKPAEEEKPACYIDKNGNYDWGKHAKDTDWKLITSITDEELCKKPTEDTMCYTIDTDYTCYVNSNNEHILSKTQPSGYTKAKSIFECGNEYIFTTSAPVGYKEVVPKVTDPKECPPEQPACYLHGEEYLWGKYENIAGYYKVFKYDEEKGEDVPVEKDECKKPETEACYKGPDGKLVWGRYAGNSKYTLVPDKDFNDCGSIPVPPTASNVSRLVYVFMAILMACGIGFIYYSSVAKKQSK